jgi:hypothetical protein
VRPDILIRSGQYFDLVNPDPAMIRFHDIAHALSNLCRFTGHTRLFYSVAQHSVLVSRIVPEEFAVAGLLHDAAEAYVGDVSTPLKKLLPEFNRIEKHIESLIAAHFGLSDLYPEAVRQADIVMLATERMALMPDDDSRWEILDGVQPSDVIISPLPPSEAYDLFVARAGELGIR